MIETPRLIMRGWRDHDIAAHNLLANDSRFMAQLGPPLPMSGSAAAAARQIAHQRDYGSCFWVVAERESGEFVGYCGISPGRAPIEGFPEIGWGIVPSRWRRGYALEAARLPRLGLVDARLAERLCDHHRAQRRQQGVDGTARHDAPARWRF